MKILHTFHERLWYRLHAWATTVFWLCVILLSSSERTLHPVQAGLGLMRAEARLSTGECGLFFWWHWSFWLFGYSPGISSNCLASTLVAFHWCTTTKTILSRLMSQRWCCTSSGSYSIVNIGSIPVQVVMYLYLCFCVHYRYRYQMIPCRLVCNITSLIYACAVSKEEADFLVALYFLATIS